MACPNHKSSPSTVKANMQASKEDHLPEPELMGQITYVFDLLLEYFSTFVFAAMDTTSGALARILHMLAQHPDTQERHRKEITESRANGCYVDYSDLNALPYLDSVIRETMRLRLFSHILFFNSMLYKLVPGSRRPP